MAICMKYVHIRTDAVSRPSVPLYSSNYAPSSTTPSDYSPLFGSTSSTAKLFLTASYTPKNTAPPSEIQITRGRMPENSTRTPSSL